MFPVVTIVIPTHNRPSLLLRAARSALAQSEPAIEVIVIDDGSDVPARIEIFDPRLRLLRNHDSIGVCAARNLGLQHARGQYVAFLDDDDELMPTMVASSLNAIRVSRLPHPVASIGGIELQSESGGSPGVFASPSSPRGLPYLLAFSGPVEWQFHPGVYATLLVPTEILRSIGGFDETLRAWEHDDLMIRVNARCSIQSIHETLVIVNDHSGQRRHQDLRATAEAIEATWNKHRKTYSIYPSKAAKLLSSGGIYYLRQGVWGSAIRLTARAFTIRPSPQTLVRLLAALVGPRISKWLVAVWRRIMPG